MPTYVGGVNDPPVATVQAVAKLHTLIDAFDALDSTKWTDISSKGLVSVTGGHLVGAGWFSLISVNAYDLSDSHIAIKVDPGTDPIQLAGFALAGLAFAPPAVNFSVSTPQGEPMMLRAYLRRVDTTTSEISVPYNSVTHAWWQIRQTSGVTYWETSPDGANWTVLFQRNEVLDFSATYVQLSGMGL